jgi:hypothetical protein
MQQIDVRLCLSLCTDEAAVMPTLELLTLVRWLLRCCGDAGDGTADAAADARLSFKLPGQLLL